MTRIILIAGGAPGAALISDPELNNSKGSTIKLTNELKETYNKLGYFRTDHQLAKELETRIVVPPKDCKIM